MIYTNNQEVKAMNNMGVMCNVCECCHNVDDCKCNLATIQVTNEYAGPNAVSTPHFCKDFEER